jgi:hypothetical protein
MQTARRSSLRLAPAILLALALPASGAEVDKYLPDDTEAVQVINIRQLLGSALMKKHAHERLEKALKGAEEVQKVLEELGFDPLKDLDSYIQTSSGGEKLENSLYILHGKFDTAKLHARAAKLAEEMANLLQVSEVDGHKLYQVNLPIPVPQLNIIYIALVDEKTLVGSLSKDYILEVFDKKAGKKKTILRKDVQELFEKFDGKQTLWMAGFRDAYLKGPIKQFKEVPGIKDIVALLEKMDHVSGGLTVTDEIKAQFTLVAGDAGEAKDISDLIEKGLADAKEHNPGDAIAKAVLDVLVKEIKVATKEAVATVTGRVSKDPIAGCHPASAADASAC